MRKFEIVKAYKDFDVLVPRRATKHSAGYDLASIEDIVIKPGEIKMIPTGLKVLIPDNEALFIYPRSSLGLKKGLMMSNGVGVVDADYYNNENNEGHIMVPLYNFSKENASVKKGERVAQGVFVSFQKTIDDDPDHEQRLGGFGSSDKKVEKIKL
jgi:dUTP pyrophosphatase